MVGIPTEWAITPHLLMGIEIDPEKKETRVEQPSYTEWPLKVEMNNFSNPVKTHLTYKWQLRMRRHGTINPNNLL